MERREVESRAIKSMGYDEASTTLEIEFRNGRVYTYQGVPPSLYEWLFKVRDKGGIFNRMIRDRFPEVEVTPVVEQDLLQAMRDSLAQIEE